MSLGGLHQEGKVPVGEQGRAARLRRERRAAFRGLVCLLTASVSLVTARLHMRLSHPSCVRALSRSLSHAGNSPKPEFQLTQRHTVSDLTSYSSFFSFQNLYFSWVFVQLWVTPVFLLAIMRVAEWVSMQRIEHAVPSLITTVALGPLLDEPVSTSKSSQWGVTLGDGGQGTCPPRLDELTQAESRSMWCIYSRVQESRCPPFADERSVWAQRGERLVQTGSRVLGWKGLPSFWAADILAYLSLSLLAFESEWQRPRVSPARLCVSVSFKR